MSLADDIVFVLSILYMVFEPVDCSSSTRVEITAPVNPVRSGNMFAICCQVWDLKRGHDVSIARIKSGIIDEISVTDGQLKSDADERYFLAKRRKDDGSVVYFLSIVNANVLTDDALYSCKVNTQESSRDTRENSVHIEVYYFPHPRYPICNSSPRDPVEIYEGRRITFTCRSEMGNPLINIKWRRLGEREEMYGDVEYPRNGIFHSELRIHAKDTDDGAIFVCEVTSTAFYSKKKTCQIGPIRVIPIPKVITTTTTTTPKPKTTPASLFGQYHQLTSSPKEAIDPLSKDSPCFDKCAEQQTLLFYWTIAAVISFVLCLVFLIMSLVLCCKVNHINNKTKSRYTRGVAPRGGGKVQNVVLTPPPTEVQQETMYVKLQKKNNNSDGRVYMTLESYDAPESRLLLPKELYEKYWNDKMATL